MNILFQICTFRASNKTWVFCCIPTRFWCPKVKFGTRCFAQIKVPNRLQKLAMARFWIFAVQKIYILDFKKGLDYDILRTQCFHNFSVGRPHLWEIAIQICGRKNVTSHQRSHRPKLVLEGKFKANLIFMSFKYLSFRTNTHIWKNYRKSIFNLY